MPNYYNHNTKESSDSPSPQTYDISTKEIKKIKIKHAKTMTNKTTMQIAEMLDCTYNYVKDLWAEVRKEEAFKLEEKVDSEIRRQVRQYEIMNVELFEAWEISKQRVKKYSQTKGTNAQGDVDIKKMTQEDRLPDPRYMEMIAKNNKAIAEMLGITKHMEVNFNQQNNEFNVITDDFTPLVPAQHDMFIKKPDQLTEGYTSIDDVDEIEEADLLDEDPPESIDG